MRSLFFLISTLFILGVSSPMKVMAQPVQTLKGTVTDRDTKQPLAGATVTITDLETIMGAIADSNGFYKIEKVPAGRRTIRCQFIGYAAYEQQGVILNSAKEGVLNIELIEASVTGETVEINGYENLNDPVNEIAVVSTRSFSPEETGRYAASANDPGRMALSFPGVQQGGNDGENDIIIRGNSSVGMLWRLEGIDIPNPNHFARPGTSGGGITVFSAQVLGQSDFFSGSLPAEYGNALSGAFDVHFRRGNYNEREHRIKIGLLGLDFMTEGPIKKGKSSYVANYRYSTLGLLSRMGFFLVGERVTNDFQDLSFNLSFNGKSGKDFFTVFGIGGLSTEHYMPETDTAAREPGVSRDWEERINIGNMAATGMTYTRLIDDKSYLKVVVAGMGSDLSFVGDTLNQMNERYRYRNEKYFDARIGTAVSYNRKISSRFKLKAGLHFNQIFFDYYREDSLRNSSSALEPDAFEGIAINGGGNTQTLQAYTQGSYYITDQLMVSAGVHLLGLFLNQTWAADPRASLRYKFNNQSLSLSYGLHSQYVPLGAYYYQDTLGNLPNSNLRFMRSHHLIMGYRITLKKKIRLSAEGYFQRLFNIPVKPDGEQEYWMLNNQQGYPTFAVINEGTGYNYGVDVTVEKFFSQNYFILLTGSYFRSTYQNLAGQTFNTRFGTNFLSSLTFTKEFNIKQASTLQLGAKVMFNGGFRYTPHDTVASAAEGRYVPLEGAAWSEQVPPFIRIDARISYRLDKPKFAMVIALDVQNVMDYKNKNSVSYNAITNALDFRNHDSGLIPILSFQFDF